MNLGEIIRALGEHGVHWTHLVLVAVIGLLGYLLLRAVAKSSPASGVGTQPSVVIHNTQPAQSTVVQSSSGGGGQVLSSVEGGASTVETARHRVTATQESGHHDDTEPVEPTKIADLIAQRIKTTAQNRMDMGDEDKLVSEILAKKKPGDDFFKFGPKE